MTSEEYAEQTRNDAECFIRAVIEDDGFSDLLGICEMFDYDTDQAVDVQNMALKAKITITWDEQKPS